MQESGQKPPFDIIDNCIPLNRAGTLPILHSVTEHEHYHLTKFAKRYPSLLFVRDQNEREIHQTEMASGHKSSGKCIKFNLCMSDGQVREKDPGTGLYPFMVAACNDISDLRGVHYLLRNPSLMSYIMSILPLVNSFTNLTFC